MPKTIVFLCAVLGSLFFGAFALAHSNSRSNNNIETSCHTTSCPSGACIHARLYACMSDYCSRYAHRWFWHCDRATNFCCSKGDSSLVCPWITNNVCPSRFLLKFYPCISKLEEQHSRGTKHLQTIRTFVSRIIVAALQYAELLHSRFCGCVSWSNHTTWFVCRVTLSIVLFPATSRSEAGKW